jgi:hypothetical protein
VGRVDYPENIREDPVILIDEVNLKINPWQMHVAGKIAKMRLFAQKK